MKKFLLIIICLVVSVAGAKYGGPLANNKKTGLYVRSIEQILRLPAKDVDLGIAALIISEQWNDDVLGREYQSRLDDMAYDVRKKLSERNIGPDHRAVKVINDYLFKDLGFTAISEATNPDDLFLHSVLDNKRGYCLSLSMLYLGLAERLGMPLYGVVVPGHFFVRYDDGNIRFNIETTSGGGTADDEHYLTKFNVPQRHQNSIYMDNLNSMQSLGCFFNNLGNSYSDVGDLVSAQRSLERAVDINPNLAESRLNLGNIYLQQGFIDDAIKQYKISLKINPNEAKVYNNLANAYNKKGLFNDAIRRYKKSIRLDPNFIEAYKNLASVYAQQQQYKKAIKLLGQAIIRQPKNSKLLCQLADTHNQSGDYNEAILNYLRALDIDPDRASAHYGLGICYGKLEKYDLAVGSYKRAIAIDPAMVSAVVNAGNIYFAREQYDLALKYYEKAVSIDNTDASIYYNIGAAFSNNKNYQDAEYAYTRAVELVPDMTDAHRGLGFVYYRLEKFALSYQHLLKAKQLGGDVSSDLIEAVKKQL